MKDKKDCCNVIHPELVEKAKADLYDTETIGKVAEFFKIFSDKTRLRIVSVLSKHELCVCDLANTLDMTHSSISHQLRILRQNHVVKGRKEGKSVYYSLDDNHIYEIFNQGFVHYTHKNKLG